MKIKWQPIVKAKTSVLFQWYVQLGHNRKYFWQSLKIKASLKNGKIVSDEIYIDLNEWVELEKVLNLEIKKDKSFLKKFIDLCYQYSDELIKSSKTVGQIKNWQKLKKKNLLSLYRNYQSSVLKLIPFLNAILVLDNVLKKEIVNLLEKNLAIKDKKEQDLLLSKLIIPKKKSFFVQETEALLKIALKLQKDKDADVKEDIKKYLKKYAWMSCLAYVGKFQTEKDVVKKIKNLIKENPKEKVIQTKQIKKETQESYQKAFANIRKSEALVDLINVAQEFIYLQTYRLDVFFLAYFYAYPLFEEIGEKFNLSASEIVYLTGKEIISLLEGKTKLDRKEIKKRIKDYALIQINGKSTLLSGDQVKKAAEEIYEEKEIKGVVANRGRVTGKTKLVNEVKDIPKVNKGDIIVSPMTHPKLVPAIVKSAGIITDFGGMLCHKLISKINAI